MLIIGMLETTEIPYSVHITERKFVLRVKDGEEGGSDTDSLVPSSRDDDDEGAGEKASSHHHIITKAEAI